MDVRTRGRVSVLGCLLLGGCVSAPTSSESPAMVHTWLLPKCPSEYIPPAAPVPPGSSLLSGLAVAAVGAVVDWLGGALDEAAKVDREGKATLGTSPGYLWQYEPDKKRRELMSCAVVTLSSSHPKNWCTVNSTFANSAPAVCGYFNDASSPANQAPSLTPGAWEGTAAPKLYAEIKLESAIDHRGILPKLATIYYPKGIHDGRFAGTKPRTLQISVAAATPEGANALSTLSVRLRDTTPVDKILRDKEIPPEQSRIWAAALAIPEKYSFPEQAASIIPVNATTEIREIGKSHAYLQALAAAFGKHKDDIKEALKAQVEAAMSQPDPNAVQSSYDQQAAAVFAAEAKVRTACTPVAPAPINSSAVRSEFLGLLESHRQLAALQAPGKPITFVPDYTTLQALHGQSATNICAAF